MCRLRWLAGRRCAVRPPRSRDESGWRIGMVNRVVNRGVDLRSAGEQIHHRSWDVGRFRRNCRRQFTACPIFLPSIFLPSGVWRCGVVCRLDGASWVGPPELPCGCSGLRGWMERRGRGCRNCPAVVPAYFRPGRGEIWRKNGRIVARFVAKTAPPAGWRGRFSPRIIHSAGAKHAAARGDLRQNQSGGGRRGKPGKPGEAVVRYSRRPAKRISR